MINEGAFNQGPFSGFFLVPGAKAPRYCAPDGDAPVILGRFRKNRIDITRERGIKQRREERERREESKKSLFPVSVSQRSAMRMCCADISSSSSVQEYTGCLDLNVPPVMRAYTMKK